MVSSTLGYKKSILNRSIFIVSTQLLIPCLHYVVICFGKSMILCIIRYVVIDTCIVAGLVWLNGLMHNRETQRVRSVRQDVEKIR